MQSPIDLSIIVVTFNCEKVIDTCLNSIRTSYNYDILVIDNTSTDNTVGVVTKNFPKVKVTENKKNLGFAKAINQALGQAQGDLILLLNPDTEILGNSLDKIASYMEKNKDLGILGPRLISTNGGVQKEITPFPQLLDSILVLLKLHRIKPFSQFVYPNYDYEKTQETEHLMGSALLIRREVFEKIGLFDENFFLWFEETDFEKRAKEAGFKIVYYPEAKVKHLVSHSIKQLSPLRRQSIWNQSLRYYFKKHHSKLEHFILEPFMFFSYLPAFLLLIKEFIIEELK